MNENSNSKPLPELRIKDESVEGSGWTWNDGWHALIPSVSNIEDAQVVLGEILESSELSNGVTYDFIQGFVRVTILDESPAIMKIRIDAKAEAPFTPPDNIQTAMSMFGKLIPLRVDRREGVFYERPGMRICCHSASSPEAVLWMEIYRPQS